MAISEAKGIAFPFRFGANGHIVRASGEAKIIGNMKALILTRIRELTFEPEKGTPAVSRLFRGTGVANSQAIAALTKQALQTFEDRVFVRGVRVFTRELQSGRAQYVEVYYKIRTTQQEGTFELRVGGDA